MYLITITDDIGRHKIVRTAQTRADIGTMQPGEHSHWANSYEDGMKKIEAINEYKKNKILKLLQTKEGTENGKAVKSSVSKYRVENVSAESWSMIEDYMNEPKENMIGELMTRHNIENWSETQFCCGTQRKRLDEVIKTIYGIRLEI